MRSSNPYRRPFTPALALTDSQLAVLGRGFTGLRLTLGEGLMHLETVGGFKRLGFPTFESYAREALGRTGRWAADVRGLAKRLGSLPLIRAEVRAGRMSLSMAELVVRVATPDDEAEWVARARAMNVRQMRAELKDRKLEVLDDEAPARVSITVTVDKVEAWAFERARMMVEAVGARRGDEAIEAMLAEGLGELLARDGDIDLPSSISGSADDHERAWRLELAALRDRAEGAAEAMMPREDVGLVEAVDVAWADEVVAVDKQLRALALTLARRDVELGELALVIADSGVWQTIGYASFDHYCRERIGLSPSSVATRVALVRRLAGLRQVEAALVGGRIGYEAAALVARVSGRATESAWVARAEARTVKLLREEIDAVELLARLRAADGMRVREVGPPDEATMADVHGVERGVMALVAGQVDEAGQMSVRGDGAAAGDEGVGGQLSVRGDGGEATLRLSLTGATAAFWKGLERVYWSVAASVVEDGHGESFVGFLVRAVMKIWARNDGAGVAYADVYLRDRWRCASPVCRSRNVTPHHVVFRSRGGGEERANLVSLCEVCHLELVHGGTMSVRGTAPARLEWSAPGWAAWEHVG